MRFYRRYILLLFCLCTLCGKANDKPFVEPIPDFIDYLMADEEYQLVVRLTSEELTRHPKNGRLYSQRAVAYIQLEEIDLAIADVTKAIRYHETADKPLSELYRIRAILYEYTNQARRAQRDYRRAAQ